MICSKRYFFLLVFALLGSFFISLLTNVNDSFAVSDLSFSVDSTYRFTSGPVFPSCNDSSCLSQYNYFIYSNSCPRNNDTANFFNISYSSSVRIRQFDSFRYFDVFSLPSDISYLQFSGIANFISSSFLVDSSPGCSITFTLTDTFSLSLPSGSLSITENGTYDVTNYSEAVVDVPAQVIQGDYHDDLTSINQSILICGAVLLVLYFFYCIYRMIIKSTGGKQ